MRGYAPWVGVQCSRVGGSYQFNLIKHSSCRKPTSFLFFLFPWFVAKKRFSIWHLPRRDIETGDARSIAIVVASGSAVRYYTLSSCKY